MADEDKLDRIESKVSELSERIEKYIAGQEQKCYDRGNKINDIKKTLYGNGRPGLATHVIFIYSALFILLAVLGGQIAGLFGG